MKKIVYTHILFFVYTHILFHILIYYFTNMKKNSIYSYKIVYTQYTHIAPYPIQTYLVYLVLPSAWISVLTTSDQLVLAFTKDK